MHFHPFDYYYTVALDFPGSVDLCQHSLQLISKGKPYAPDLSSVANSTSTHLKIRRLTYSVRNLSWQTIRYVICILGTLAEIAEKVGNSLANCNKVRKLHFIF